MPDEGLGSAKIPIRPDLEGLEPELEKARGKIEGKLNGVFSKLGGTLAKAGKAAVVGGLGAIVAGTLAIGGAGLASAMQFDEAFDNIQTKTGATGAVLEQLKADAKGIFTAMPVEIGAAADVVGTLNQRLGMSGEAAQKLGSQLLMMGTGDAAASTALYTRVIGDWGIKNEDASATLDKLFKASQLTGVGVDDLMSKVVQFGAPLRLMGFSIEESAAMFGKWEKEGVNAELVMGSLRIAAGKFAKDNAEGNSVQMGGVKSMAEANKKLVELKENLAIATQKQSEFTDKTKASSRMAMDKKIRDYSSAITELESAMAKGEFRTVQTEGAQKSLGDSLRETFDSIKNNTDASAALALGMEVFGARAGPDMTAAIREGRFSIDDLTKAMGDSENAIIATAEATMDFPEKFKLIKNKVQTALVPIGSEIMNAFGGAVDTFGPLFEEKILPILEERIVPAVQTLGTALAQVMGGDLSGGLATLFGEDKGAKIVETIDKIKGAFDRISGAFKTGGLGGGLKQIGKELSTALGPLLDEALATIQEKLPEWTTKLGAAISTAVSGAWGWLKTNIGPLAQEGWTAFLGILENVASFLNTEGESTGFGIGAAISNALSSVFQSLFGGGGGEGGGSSLALDLLSGLLKLLGGVIDGLVTAITGDSEWFTKVKGAFSAAFPRVIPTLQELPEIASKITGFMNGIGEFFSSTLPTTMAVLETIGTQIIDGMIGGIKAKAGALVDAAKSVVGDAISAAKKLLGISSPSKVFADIGGMMMAGMGEGLVGGQGGVLQGVSAAIGPVIDRVLDFARSIGGPQAQAMKNVASAFKDMAKGIDEIAGAMNKIGSFQGGGGGGAGGFSAMLDQFAVIATEAAARIDAITSAIGYNRIHKLKLTAGRLSAIIQAVLVDLSGIVAREFPDLAVWFSQFQDIIQRALVVMNAIYGKYGLAVVQRAAEIATALATVLQLLGVDLANIVPPPINFEMLLMVFLAALAVAAEAMIPWLADIRATFSGPVLNGAVETAEALGAIIGVLSLATILADLSKDENKPGEGLTTLVQNVLDGLKGALEILVPGLEEIETRWGEALKRLAGVTDTMRQFFTGIKDANAAAIEFSNAEEIDLNGLMRRIGSLNAATGAAITGLTAPTPGAPGAEQGGGGGVTVNLYMEGQLMGTFTQQTNDAGQVDIRLGEMMSAS